ncbi:hypothetical protein [Rufibacter hautae]|uniref:Uncharacterized protein n=1 Tax=Rufibacter hautae TaxID=2595005 RepID=A0A5B6TAU7_9BACT|nr:hypothetical protein [Rufibacter hautae]KAA3437579.1 hypothetical protein FOA19_09700 [Rufibacter hautae]
MESALQIQDYFISTNQLDEIHASLHAIQQHFLKELAYKQSLLEAKDLEISQLKTTLNKKDQLVEELRDRVITVEKNNEGNKQLNKKLISEIVRKQQDIEWYKRTYESRSLLGTLKQKLFKSI